MSLEEYRERAFSPAMAQQDFETQVKLRQFLFQKYVTSDERFTSLAPEAQQQFFKSALYAAPAGLSASTLSKFQPLVSSLESPETADDALKALTTSITANAVARESIIAQAAARGVAALTELFTGSKGKENEAALSLLGPEGDKLNDWAMASIQRLRGDEAAQGAASSMAANTMLFGLGENLLLTVATVGSVGAPGLFTKGLFGAGGKLANFTKGAVGWSRFGKEALVQGAESAIQAIVGTSRDTLLDYFQNPDKDVLQRLQTIGTSFGNNVMFDYLVWAGLRTASRLGGGVVRSIAGIKSGLEGKLDTPEAIRDTARTMLREDILDPGFRKSLSPEQQAELYQNTARYLSKTIPVNSLEGNKVLINSLGFDLATSGSTFTLANKLDPEQTFTFKSLDEARLAALEFWQNGAFPVKATPLSSKDAALAAADTKLLYKETGNISNLPREQRAELLLPVNGKYDSQRLTMFLKSEIGDGYLVRTAPALQDGFVIRGNTLLVPETVSSLDAQVKVTNGILDFIASKTGEPIGAVKDLMPKLFSKGAMNPQGVDYLSKTYLEQPLQSLGNGKYSIGNVTYNSLREANNAVYDKMVTQGKLNLDTLSETFHKSTGLEMQFKEGQLFESDLVKNRLTPEALAANKEYGMFIVRKGDKGILDQDSSLERLFNRHPEWRMGMPDSYAPSMAVIDPEKGLVSVEKAVVQGRVSQLLEMGMPFMPDNSASLFFKNADGEILKRAAPRFVVRNYALGFDKEFSNLGQAKAWLAQSKIGLDELNDAVAQRGLRLSFDPDGTYSLYDHSGHVSTFSTKNELQLALAKMPTPDWAKELAPLDPSTIVELDKVSALRGLRTVESKKGAFGIARFAKEMGARTENTLEQFAKETGEARPRDAWRELDKARRLADSGNNRIEPILNEIFAKTKKSDRIMMMQFLARPEADWGKMRELAGDLVSNDILDKVKMTRSLLDEIFNSSGIAADKFLTSYAPRIRKFVFDNPDLMTGDANATTIARMAFPEGLPKELEFVASNMRQNAFVEMMIEEDPIAAMRVYINSVNKAKYLQPALTRARQMVKDVPRDSQYMKFFNDSVNRMFGRDVTPAEKALNDMVFSLTRKVSENIKKMGVDSEFANSILTTDLLGKLHEKFTYATQAMRPWVIPRNLLQVNNLELVVPGGIVAKAFRDVTLNETGQETVQRLLKSGAFTQTGIDLGTNVVRSVNSPAAETLKWMENSDIITRATAYRASELMWDEFYPLWKDGKISNEAFSKAFSFDMFDKADFDAMMQALNTGNRAAFIDTHGTKLMDFTMFKYQKGSQPRLQRGLLGKMFGKVGTYPMSQIELYSRVLGRGDLSSRTEKVARFMLTSFATFEAFKAFGIEYSGFLWNDPFEFSGGPYFNIVVNALNSIGDGQDNAQARSRLLNDFTRLSIPMVSYANNFSNGLNYLSQGKEYEATLAFMGAPVRSDLRIRNPYSLPQAFLPKWGN